MRIVHLFVICALIFAAAYVYRIKMESTVRTEKVMRLRAEIRDERDGIAALRAEWSKLDAPRRLQGLAERHLDLKPIDGAQFDTLKNLPERPPNFTRTPDPIGSMLEAFDSKSITGSIPAAPAQEPAQ
jgi:hypothetical protein